MTKLISILCPGHSGSTLLDLVCGSIPGVFSLGESTFLPWQLYRTQDSRATIDQQDICTCGRSFQECQVWNPVISKLSNRVGFDIFKDPFRFRIALLRNQEYGRNGRLNRLKRRIFSELIQHSFAKPVTYFCTSLLKRIVDNNWLLFDVLAESQKISYIIDSSKDPLRFWLLHNARPSETHVIVLFRDIRGVVNSSVKRKKENGAATAMIWVHYYNRILDILRSIPQLNIMVIRYEQLCSNPLGVRETIAKQLGSNCLSESINIDTRTHHMIAGNPMRYKGIINIRPDDSWKHELDGTTVSKAISISKGLRPEWRELGYDGTPFSQ